MPAAVCSEPLCQGLEVGTRPTALRADGPWQPHSQGNTVSILKNCSLNPYRDPWLDRPFSMIPRPWRIRRRSQSIVPKAILDKRRCHRSTPGGGPPPPPNTQLNPRADLRSASSALSPPAASRSAGTDSAISTATAPPHHRITFGKLQVTRLTLMPHCGLDSTNGSAPVPD